MKAVKKQAGFTLIELVVVIVILGILAATAAPRFIDLQDDATTATLQAIEASMESASTLVHSKSLIKGNQASAGGASIDVSVNGVDVLIRYGYPRDNNNAAIASWLANLLELDANTATSEFTVRIAHGGIIIHPRLRTVSGAFPADINAPTAAESNCFVRYREVDAAGNRPQIDTIPCV